MTDTPEFPPSKRELILAEQRDASYFRLAEAEQRTFEHKAANELLKKQLAEAQEKLNAVHDLINETTGVAGLHLNGDIAPWSDLLSGGRFEGWLGVLGDREGEK